MAGMARGCANRHSKNKNYYANYFGYLAAKKARAKEARKRWLARRQSAEVRIRMAAAWNMRHSVDYSRPVRKVSRYGCDTLINTPKGTSNA